MEQSLSLSRTMAIFLLAGIFGWLGMEGQWLLAVCCMVTGFYLTLNKR